MRNGLSKWVWNSETCKKEAEENAIANFSVPWEGKWKVMEATTPFPQATDFLCLYIQQKTYD